MNKLCAALVVVSLLLNVACTSSRVSSIQLLEDKELTELVKLMTGHFSSAQQAKEDSLFYDISLVMHQIWNKDTEAKWLYVEQAVTKNILKPYRQRIYRLSKMEDGQMESRIYKLPNDSLYIHAWESPEIFKRLQPKDLIIREGCSVFLEKISGDCYYGSTKNKECKSSLRGAQYATSAVTICTNQMVSWDQGWDGDDAQVWGAKTEGYIFRRIFQ